MPLNLSLQARNTASNEVRKLRDDVKRLGDELNQLKTKGKGANQQLKQTGALSGIAAKGLGQLAGVAAGIVSIQSAISGLKSASRFIIDFDRAMSKVQVVTGATEDQMSRLERTARDLGASTIFSASQAAEGMEFLARAGFDTERIIAALPGVLDLAAGSAISLGDAADITTNIMSAFNIEAEKTTEVADLLAFAAANSNTTVIELGEGMKFVAPLARSLGISIVDTTAAMGALADQGIKSGIAGRRFNSMLTRLLDITPEAEQALIDMGLSVEEVSIRSNDLGTILQRLRDHGFSATNGAVELFGREMASTAVALVNGTNKFEELGDEMENVTGFARKMGDILGGDLAGQLDELGGSVEELLLNVRDLGGEAALSGAFRGLTAEIRETNEVLEAAIKLKDAFFTDKSLPSGAERTRGLQKTDLLKIFGGPASLASLSKDLKEQFVDSVDFLTSPEASLVREIGGGSLLFSGFDKKNIAEKIYGPLVAGAVSALEAPPSDGSTDELVEAANNAATEQKKRLEKAMADALINVANLEAEATVRSAQAELAGRGTGTDAISAIQNQIDGRREVLQIERQIIEAQINALQYEEDKNAALIEEIGLKADLKVNAMELLELERARAREIAQAQSRLAQGALEVERQRTQAELRAAQVSGRFEIDAGADPIAIAEREFSLRRDIELIERQILETRLERLQHEDASVENALEELRIKGELQISEIELMSLERERAGTLNQIAEDQAAREEEEHQERIGRTLDLAGHLNNIVGQFDEDLGNIVDSFLNNLNQVLAILEQINALSAGTSSSGGAGILGSFLGNLGSVFSFGFGGGAAAPISGAAHSGLTTAFNFLHDGGLVERLSNPVPGLGRNEVPIIAKAGETVATEDQMAFIMDALRLLSQRDPVAVIQLGDEQMANFVSRSTATRNEIQKQAKVA